MFNVCPHTILVFASSKLKLAKRVIEKESRGWECVKPLHTKNQTSYYVNRYGKRIYFSNIVYAVVMRREKTGE